jgi:O-antigen/teichoic acid export membrane protein
MAAHQPIPDTFSTDHLHADLRDRSVRGGIWTVTAQGVQFVLQSAATITLARLLTPTDFGLVAMVTAITGLGQAFADLGLSEATIQRSEITHPQVSNLFWINVGIGLLLTSTTAALAPFFAWFYREPALRNITLVVSLTFLIGGLRVQHDALLRRQMRFTALAIRDILAYLLAVPASILLAWRGAGYWAIVALPMILNGTQMVLSWTITRWIPSLPSRATRVRSLITFGGHVAASYLIIAVNSNADNVLVGWYWGAGPLGLYSRAYNLLMLPVRQFGSPARSVAIPALSRVQDEPERLARYYLGATNLMLWATAPMFGFLFVAARPIIVLTLGKQWHAAAPVFQILVIVALGQLLLESNVWLFVSRGQSRMLMNLLMVISPILIASYAIGLPFGIKGVALCGSVMLIGIFPWILRYSFRGTVLTLGRLGRAVRYPIAVALAGVAVSEAVLQLTDYKRMVPLLLISALGFALGAVAMMSVPAVRRELVSLKGIISRARSEKSSMHNESASVAS